MGELENTEAFLEQAGVPRCTVIRNWFISYLLWPPFFLHQPNSHTFAPGAKALYWPGSLFSLKIQRGGRWRPAMALWFLWVKGHSLATQDFLGVDRFHASHIKQGLYWQIVAKNWTNHCSHKQIQKASPAHLSLCTTEIQASALAQRPRTNAP